MTIIEADGQNTEPLTVDEIQIFAAQRYSFVVSLHLHRSSASGEPWALTRAGPAESRPGDRQLLDPCPPQPDVQHECFGIC